MIIHPLADFKGNKMAENYYRQKEVFDIETEMLMQKRKEKKAKEYKDRQDKKALDKQIEKIIDERMKKALKLK